MTTEKMNKQSVLRAKLEKIDRRIEKQKATTEKQFRTLLKKEGYQLKKSRVKNINADNLGGFMIVDANTNTIVAGSRYELNEMDVYNFTFDKITES